MAEKKDDVLGVLLQEVFSEPNGVRRVLEHLLGAAMAQEVEGQVAAKRAGAAGGLCGDVLSGGKHPQRGGGAGGDVRQ